MSKKIRNSIFSSSRDINFSKLSSGGLVKAVPGSGTLEIAVPGEDYLVPNKEAYNQIAFFSESGVISGSNNLYFDGTNVGIGTTNLSCRLNVNGNVKARSLIVEDINGIIITPGNGILTLNDSILTINGSLTFSGTNGITINFGNHNLSFSTVVPSTVTIPGSGTVVFGTGSSNLLTKWIDGSHLGTSIIYDDGNNVGIGNIDSAYKLNVDGNINATSYYLSGIKISPVMEGNNRGETLYWNGSSWKVSTIFYNNNQKIGIGTTSPSQLFQINKGQSIFVVTNKGNVGIGVENPKAKLEINGNVLIEDTESCSLMIKSENLSSYLVIDRKSITDNAVISFRTNGNNVGEFDLGEFGNQRFGIRRADNRIELLTINGSGNVGIGISEPNYKLEVNGDFKANTISPVFGPYTITIPSSGTIVLGNGNANYLAKWDNSNSLNASIIYDDGQKVGIGTNNPKAKLEIIPKSDEEIIFGTQSLQSTPKLGKELILNGTFEDESIWILEKGWVYNPVTKEMDHFPGFNDALIQVIPLTAKTPYYLEFAIDNRSNGFITLDFNGNYVLNENNSTEFFESGVYHKIIITETSELISLKITPSADFNGSLKYISLKEVIGSIQANLSLLDDTGQVYFEIKGKSELSSFALGTNSLERNISGKYNIALGRHALAYNIVGDGNLSFGENSLTNNLTGNYNIGVGKDSLFSNKTGNNNIAIGHGSLFYNINGCDNIALGENAGSLIIDGNRNENSSFSIYMGKDTRASSNAVNEIVIGFKATGNGSNSVTLGNSSIVKTVLQGNVGIGTGEFGSDASKVLALVDGTPPSSSPKDTVQLYADKEKRSKKSCLHIRDEEGNIIKLYKEDALTPSLGTINHEEPETLNYDIQDFVSGGYGFASRDEGNTVLKIIVNMQKRINQLEKRLQNFGLLPFFVEE